MALKIKKIKPMFNQILTTAWKYGETETLSKNGLLLDLKKKEGNYKLYQKVLAVGPTVRDIKVGDVVQFDVIKFIVPEHKEDSNSLREMTHHVRNSYTQVELPVIEVNDEECILTHESAVEFILEDYED